MERQARHQRRAEAKKLQEEEEEAEALEERPKDAEQAAVVEPPTDDYARLKAYFLTQLKQGILPSMQQLRDWSAAESVKLPITSKLKSLRYNWKISAMLSRWQGAKRFMGCSIAKVGVIMLDLAYYMKQHVVKNKQKKYFLVGVDILSGQLACIAVRTKERKDWQWAILEMLKNSYEYISHIITDRDGAIVSKSFRRELRLKFGISWSFLM